MTQCGPVTCATEMRRRTVMDRYISPVARISEPIIIAMGSRFLRYPRLYSAQAVHLLGVQATARPRVRLIVIQRARGLRQMARLSSPRGFATRRGKKAHRCARFFRTRGPALRCSNFPLRCAALLIDPVASKGGDKISLGPQHPFAPPGSRRGRRIANASFRTTPAYFGQQWSRAIENFAASQ